MIALTCLIYTQNSFAANTKKVVIANATITDSNVASAQPETKKIYLTPIVLNEKQIKKFKSRWHDLSLSALNAPVSEPSDLPPSFQAGMNNTPVLDQGHHNSCAIFATTAAIDALLGKGDYISQLCLLELGRYFENYRPQDPSGRFAEVDTMYPSGWSASDPETIVNQISHFGLISKDKQIQGLCAGVKEYPLANIEDEGRPMTLEAFSQQSEPLDYVTKDGQIQTLTYKAFRPENYEPVEIERLLQKVKQSLVETGHSNSRQEKSRLVMFVLLPAQICKVGACVSFHKANDTWAITKEIKDPIKHFSEGILGGHVMVITGYDDNAIVTDLDGKKHQGLLTLRNSWGANVGDGGDFYMSYDFFKFFVVSVSQIGLDSLKIDLPTSV